MLDHLNLVGEFCSVGIPNGFTILYFQAHHCFVCSFSHFFWCFLEVSLQEAQSSVSLIDTVVNVWFPVQAVGDINAEVLGLVDIFQRVASQSIGCLMGLCGFQPRLLVMLMPRYLAWLTFFSEWPLRV